MTATYSKLQSGQWGIRIAGERPVPGQAVIVTKRNGNTHRETVTRVLSSGPDSHLCEIAVDNKPCPRCHTYCCGDCAY